MTYIHEGEMVPDEGVNERSLSCELGRSGRRWGDIVLGGRGARE